MSADTIKQEFTKSDEYRRELSSDLALAYQRLGRANSTFKKADAHRKEAKAHVDACQGDVNELAEQLAQVESGNYQPPLFVGTNGQVSGKNGANTANGESGAAPVDDGGLAPLNVLLDFDGVTEGLLDKIQSSQLSTEFKLETILDFEAVLKRESEWWWKKVDGIGKGKGESFYNAYVDYRMKFPPPSEEDEEEQETPLPVDPAAEPSDTDDCYLDRNGAEGTDCTTVERTIREGNGWSVTVATSCLGEGGYRSSVQWTIGEQILGRDVPIVESQPHSTKANAARAALGGLVVAWNNSGGERKEASLELSEWMESEWPLEEGDES